MTTLRIKSIDINPRTVVEVGRFTILWGAFENDMCDNKCTNIRLEQIAKRCSPSIQWQAFAAALKARAAYLDINIDTYVDSYLFLSRARSAVPQKKVKKFIASGGNESFSGGFMAIYRIRNNMFHGEKWMKKGGKRLELFIAASNLLEALLKTGGL